MASAISTYITQLQNAVYGEEVRQAIINSLQRCYDDVNNPTLTKAAFESILFDMATTGSLQESMLNYLDILTEVTDNKFDVLTSSIGRLNQTTGALETQYTNFFTSDWIAVNEGDLVYLDWCNYKIFYDVNKNYVQSVPASAAGATPFTVPAGGGYIRISTLRENRPKASVYIGTRIIPYIPGRTSIDYAIRAAVYRKTEIDTMLLDFELTDNQKAELISLLN